MEGSSVQEDIQIKWIGLETNERKAGEERLSRMEEVVRWPIEIERSKNDNDL